MSILQRIAALFSRRAAATPEPAQAPALPAASARVTAQQYAAALARVTRLPESPFTDGGAYAPRSSDFDTVGLRDPDTVIENDTDGYARLYGNDHIASCLRRRYDKAASATFSAHGEGATANLIAPLEDFVVGAPGLREGLHSACDAIVQGISYLRTVFERQRADARGNLVQRIARFVRHDKRRFRLATVDRENFGLVDDGTVTIGGATYYFPRTRHLWVIPVWQDEESRLGSGHGIGARLDRAAEEDEKVHRMELRTLEKFGGSIVDVFMREGFEQVNPADILATGKVLKSGDTMVWPSSVADVKRTLLGEAVVKAFSSKRADIRSQISKLINGTDFANMGETGTYGLGAALAGEELALAQADGDWLASHVIPQIVRGVLAQNPWIYAATGTTPETPLPTWRAEVDVGRAPKEVAEVLAILGQQGYEITPEVASELVGIPIASKGQRAPSLADIAANMGGGAGGQEPVSLAEVANLLGLARRATARNWPRYKRSG